MDAANCKVRILVRDRQVTEFDHEGQVYVEGRSGSEFEIEIRNTTNQRVLAVVSVDGTSVIDGEPAGPYSPGYTIKAYQTIRIPGWKLNTGDQAAKFTFGSRASSYVNTTTESDENCGVIGVMLWNEKQKQVFVPNNAHFPKGITRSISPNDYWLGGIAGASIASSDTTYTVSATAQASTPTLSTNNLGTEFGKATSFKTTETTFDRDAVVDTVVINYDDARGLKARGIVIDRSVQRSSSSPNPFPGVGCTPPKGWKG